MRIGAVNYLNSKPLVEGLEDLAPQVQLSYDLPSRLADSLSAGNLDVALIPSVEFFRTPGYRIVSDACVACRGPVLSVKLYFRVPPREVRRVALDEGSRTSSALTQIMLAELCDSRPRCERLPIGYDPAATDADAVLLIGDRAIASEGRELRVGGRGPENMRAGDAAGPAAPSPEPPAPAYVEVWDLGERWWRWTGLPFVFAMWVARPNVDPAEAGAILKAARDRGVRRLSQIAAREAVTMQIPRDLATRYLRNNLHFSLGRRECDGLLKFYSLCVQHGLAPSGLDRMLQDAFAAGCTAL